MIPKLSMHRNISNQISTPYEEVYSLEKLNIPRTKCPTFWPCSLPNYPKVKHTVDKLYVSTELPNSCIILIEDDTQALSGILKM